MTGSSRRGLRVAGGVLAVAMLAGCGAGPDATPDTASSTVTSGTSPAVDGSQPTDPNGRRACLILGDVVAGQRADDLAALDEVAAAAAQSIDAGIRTGGDRVGQQVGLVRGSAGQPDEERHRQSLRQAVEDLRRACAEIGLD